jgi:hypothetical protein
MIMPCWHPPLCQLGWNLTLGCTEEFVRDVKAFAPLALALVSLKMINALLVLHPSNANSPCLGSLLDFQLDWDLEVSMDSFRSIFLPMFHLLVGGPSSMVFEYLQDYFDPKDLANGFIQLH